METVQGIFAVFCIALSIHGIINIARQDNNFADTIVNTVVLTLFLIWPAIYWNII